jgi:hypothetical protein
MFNNFIHSFTRLRLNLCCWINVCAFVHGVLGNNVCVYYNMELDNNDADQVKTHKTIDALTNAEDFILILTDDCEKTNKLLNIVNGDLQVKCNGKNIAKATSNAFNWSRNVVSNIKVITPEHLSNIKTYSYLKEKSGFKVDDISKPIMCLMPRGLSPINNNYQVCKNVATFIRRSDLPEQFSGRPEVTQEVTQENKNKYLDEMIKSYNEWVNSYQTDDVMKPVVDPYTGGRPSRRLTRRLIRRPSKRPKRKTKSSKGTKRRRGTRKRANKKR